MVAVEGSFLAFTSFPIILPTWIRSLWFRYESLFLLFDELGKPFFFLTFRFKRKKLFLSLIQGGRCKRWVSGSRRFLIWAWSPERGKQWLSERCAGFELSFYVQSVWKKKSDIFEREGKKLYTMKERKTRKAKNIKKFEKKRNFM